MRVDVWEQSNVTVREAKLETGVLGDHGLST